MVLSQKTNVGIQVSSALKPHKSMGFLRLAYHLPFFIEFVAALICPFQIRSKASPLAVFSYCGKIAHETMTI